MTDVINVGLIGIGGMGRMHFNCYRNNPYARIIALCDIDRDKRCGKWSDMALNIGTDSSNAVDLAGVSAYADYADLIANPAVRIVDICLPTPLHAPVAIAALRAGKDVLCEKPMAWDDAQCRAIEEAQTYGGGQLMIGHCLRYWPIYVDAATILCSGKYGDWRYASFHRSGAVPRWSWDNWLMDGSRSGGAVFDMHVHDADTALWWFGEPQSIKAAGTVVDGLPLTVDATWGYSGGRVAALHGSWDLNGGAFRYAFQIVMQKGTISFDSAVNGNNLRIITNDSDELVPVSEELAYQLEIDDFVDCVRTGRKLDRITPGESRLSVSVVSEELRQILATTR